MTRNKALLLEAQNVQPICLYQLDGTLKDEFGGLDLTLDTGTERYGQGAVPDRRAGYFDGATILARGAHDASLLVLGDVTLQALVFPVLQDAGTFVDILEFCGLTETETDNCPWYMGLSGVGNSPRWFHEFGAGASDETFIWSDVSIPPFQWTHLAMVRDDSAMTVTLYVNGQADPTVFNYTNSATGGGTSRLGIGGFWPANVQFFEGLISSCKVMSSALSAGLVQAEAERTLATIKENIQTSVQIVPQLSPDQHPNVTLYHRADQHDADDGDLAQTPTVIAGANGVTQATAGNRPFLDVAGGQPSWRTWDGSSTASGGRSFTGGTNTLYITNNPADYHVFCAFLLEDASQNSGSLWLNHRLFGDPSGFFGAYARRNSGVVEVYGYHWDGAARVTPHRCSLGEIHLLEMWYEGGQTRSRLDDGPEVNVAAGNISGSGTFALGGAGTDVFPGYICEMMIANGFDANSVIRTRHYFANTYGMFV